MNTVKYFLICWMSTTVHTVTQFPTVPWKIIGRSPRYMPCGVICSCSSLDEYTHLVDCSKASDPVQLEQFVTPIPKVRQADELSLIIMGSELPVLESLALGNLSFSGLHVKYNPGLESIADHVLDGSKKSLRILDLRNNGFRKVPHTSLNEFVNLEFISLDDNIISKIPRTVSNLTQLLHVTMANNHIERIENRSMIGLPSLEFLDFHGNKLENITAFPEMQNLHSLLLWGNPIKYVSIDAFKNLPNLEILDLSYCQIQTLGKDQLSLSSSKPLFMSLAYNPLTNVPSETFGSGIYPQWLNLKGTQMRSLEETTFRPILEDISQAVLVHERNGHPRIMLDGSPLSCDCSMKWLATNLSLLEVTSGLCIDKNIEIRRLDPDYFYRFCF